MTGAPVRGVSNVRERVCVCARACQNNNTVIVIMTFGRVSNRVRRTDSDGCLQMVTGD